MKIKRYVTISTDVNKIDTALTHGYCIKLIIMDTNENKKDYIENTKAKSWIWKYFGLKNTKDEKNIAVCKLCLAEVKYSGGTSNLQAHINRRHPSSKVKTEETKKGISQSQDTTKPSTGTQQKLPGFFEGILPPNSQRAKIITEKIARYLVKDMRPFSTVDSPEFRDLIKTLEPRWVSFYI